MLIILLAKQVPDISIIPPDAWDEEKGVLRRSMLPTALNPHDLKALAFALKIKASLPEVKILTLTMGPTSSREMLEEFLSRGADEAILLTDMAFAGADTAATAYALAFAIRRIVEERQCQHDCMIVAGAQSQDGDTAQVPPQVAEELGVEYIAWACGVEADSLRLKIDCLALEGLVSVTPKAYPFVLSVMEGFEAPPRSFHRRREKQVVGVWNAEDIKVPLERVGFKGSRTWVSGVYSVLPMGKDVCVRHRGVESFLDALSKGFQGLMAQKEAVVSSGCVGATDSLYTGDIWVYAQVGREGLLPVVSEMLGKARDLAVALKVKVGAVLIGDDVSFLVPRLFEAGADKVYVSEHARLKSLGALSVHKKVLADMITRYQPQIVLLGATMLGRALAPRVAYALSSGLTADCTAFEIVDHKGAYGVLKQIRPALGGNIMAAILSKDSFCQMATVRPGVFKAPSIIPGKIGEVVLCPADLNLPVSGIDILGVKDHERLLPFESVSVIVAGGRGVRSKLAFEKELKEFSRALSDWLKVDVVLGASRLAVENGWMSHAHQIGQTGTSVAPRLYIAVGISGSIQHLAGIAHAGCVAAINADEKAMIFKRADHGMVGRFEDVVPALTAAIRRRCA